MSSKLKEETQNVLKKFVLEMLTETESTPLYSRYYDILEEESDCEDIETTDDFVSNEVAYFSAGSFQCNFRMNKEIVYKLIEQYEQSGILRNDDSGRKKISAEKTILMALWYLVNMETFRELSSRFKVAYSSAYRTLKRVMEFLISMAPDVIKWPQKDDYPTIAAEFNEMQGIDNVIGAIDACHIKIERPKEDSECYLNNKGFYSLKVQAICTTNYLFTDIHCGQPGSYSDASILRTSSIFFKFLDPDFHGDFFIVADEAYPLYDWLVPAFKFGDDLTEDQQFFNLKLASTRSPSDVTFALLKGRFKRLTQLHNLNITTAAEMIMGACILHNICVLNEDDTEIEIFDISDDLLNTDLNEEDIDDTEDVDNKRDVLFNGMFNKCIASV